MSNRTRRTDTALSAQQRLFDSGAAEGSLDILLGLKQMMSRLAHDSGKDRYAIAAGMSRAMRRDVTRDMLDKYTSSDPAYEPGAVKLLAFCAEVHSLQPFSYLLGHLGSDVLNPEDRDLLDLARLIEQQKKIEAEILQIRVRRGIK